MNAGQNIFYLPNTTVQPGGYMWGYISSTGPYCLSPSMPAVITAENDPIPMVFEKSSFKIYPNPTDGRFTLELIKEPQNTPVVVKIFNMMSSQILETVIHSGRFHEFNLSNQFPGIYLIKVEQDNQISIWKVILK